MKTFFRDHTNPIRKKEKILVKTFLDNTLCIWKYFFLNIRGDLCPPPPKLLCPPMAMACTVYLI